MYINLNIIIVWEFLVFLVIVHYCIWANFLCFSDNKERLDYR